MQYIKELLHPSTWYQTRLGFLLSHSSRLLDPLSSRHPHQPPPPLGGSSFPPGGGHISSRGRVPLPRICPGRGRGLPSRRPPPPSRRLPYAPIRRSPDPRPPAASAADAPAPPLPAGARPRDRPSLRRRCRYGRSRGIRRLSPTGSASSDAAKAAATSTRAAGPAELLHRAQRLNLARPVAAQPPTSPALQAAYAAPRPPQPSLARRDSSLPSTSGSALPAPPSELPNRRDSPASRDEDGAEAVTRPDHSSPLPAMPGDPSCARHRPHQCRPPLPRHGYPVLLSPVSASFPVQPLVIALATS
jgi:hypothetical protein